MSFHGSAFVPFLLSNKTPSSGSITFDWPTAGQYLSNLAWSGSSCHQEFKPYLYSLRMWVPRWQKYLHGLWVCRPWSYFWQPGCSLIILLVCGLSIILEAGKINIFTQLRLQKKWLGEIIIFCVSYAWMFLYAQKKLALVLTAPPWILFWARCFLVTPSGPLRSQQVTFHLGCIAHPPTHPFSLEWKAKIPFLVRPG